MADKEDLRVAVSEVVDLLRITGRFAPALREVIERKLTASVARAKGVSVSPEELQDAADLFRIVNGLHRAGDTEAWMKENGITVETLESYLETDLLVRKFRYALEDGTPREMYVSSPEIQEAIGDMIYRDWLDGALK